MGKHLKLWRIVIGFTTLLGVTIACTRTVGLSRQTPFPCFVRGDTQMPVVLDPNRPSQIRLSIQRDLVDELDPPSPDHQYRLLARKIIEGQNTKYSVLLQSNSSGKMVEIPDYGAFGARVWSPDSKYVAVSALKYDDSQNTLRRVVLVVAVAGNKHQAIETGSQSYGLWSDDSRLLSLNTEDGAVIVDLRDFSQYRITDRPQSLGYWLPRSHRLIYLWGQPNRVGIGLFNFDTKSEVALAIPHSDGASLNETLSPDRRLWAIYQGDGNSNSRLRIFDLSTGTLNEIPSEAKHVSFSSYFWTPDNQALGLVDTQGGLTLYYLQENRSERLVQDGISQLLETTDKSIYLLVRQQHDHSSLSRLNLNTKQISLVTDNIAYVQYSQPLPWSDYSKLFIVSKTQDTFSVDLYEPVTDKHYDVASEIPTLPLAREWAGSVVTIIWKSSTGGGLLKYSLENKTSRSYHVDIGTRWDLGETRHSFSPDDRYVAISLREPGGTALQIASLDNSPRILLYQSTDSYNWASTMYWSADSSELLYSIYNGGPVKVVQRDGTEIAAFSPIGDSHLTKCNDYFGW